MTKRSWTNWYWVAWLLIAIGVGFLVPEMVAIFDSRPETQPLTTWAVSKGLATVAAIVGLWLFIHFWRRRGGA